MINRSSVLNVNSISIILFVGLMMHVTAHAQESIGGGTVSNPAQGPGASFSKGTGLTLVKNWNFGSGGTVRNMTDMDNNFQYHDQFNQISCGGGKYGALMVASSTITAIKGTPQGDQPVEDASHPVRSFSADYLRTFLVPLNGADPVVVSQHNSGSGSFVAKWTLPNGGSRLSQVIVWETRARYNTPPYFWFAIWAAGNQWNGGAEMDVVEGFGYDNGGGYTNYDGRYWHSNSVGGTDQINYSNWGNGMAAGGVSTFDPLAWHIWQWVYRKDNTCSVFMDNHEVQKGTIQWTLGATSNGTPINMYFLFDGAWGHTEISSVNKSIPASNFDGKYYDWDYSRVYIGTLGSTESSSRISRKQMTTRILGVDIPVTGIACVALINAKGEAVRTWKGDMSGLACENLNRYPAGAYIIKVLGSSGVVSQVVVIDN